MSPDEARTTFSAAHFVYIPLCVLAGIIVGWVLGNRSARAEVTRLRGLLAVEEERQAARRMTSNADP